MEEDFGEKAGEKRGDARHAPVLPLGMGLLGGQWLAGPLGFWAFVLSFSLWVAGKKGWLLVNRGGGLLLFGAWVGALLPLPPLGDVGIRGKERGAVLRVGLGEGVGRDGVQKSELRAGPLRFSGTLLTRPTRGAHGGLRGRLRVGGEIFRLWLLHPGPAAESYGRGTRLRGLGFLEPGKGGMRQIKSIGALIHAQGAEAGPSKIRRKLLLSLEENLDRRLGPPAASLCKRLFLGISQNDSLALQDLHRRLGISHFLAISGLHTILLAGILSWILRPLGTRRDPALAGLLLFYAWLTGLRPPVLRAVIGFLLYRWCHRRGRPFLLDSAFALSALVTLLLAPQERAGIGFALSYLAVAGLAWITPLLARMLQRGGDLRRGNLTVKLRSLLLASLAAWIATLPLSLLAFHRSSPWGILLSPLLVPLLFLLLLGCLASVLVPLLPSPIPGLLFGALQGSCDLYLGILHHLDRLGLPVLLTSPALPSLGIWILFATGLGLAAWRASPRIFLSSCLLTSLLALLPWGRVHKTELTLLPVGDGQCVVVQTGGRVIVLDCGDREGGRRAKQLLADFMAEEALPRIDLLVLSHADSDHSGALEGLLQSIPIAEVLLPAHPKCAALLQILRNHGQAHRLLLPGESLERFGLIQTSLPLESADLETSNDGGLISLIKLQPSLQASLDFLCLGDQEGNTLDRILELLPKRTQKRPLALLLPHHGAPSEALARFVKNLSPSLLLESSGRTRALRQESFHQHLRRPLWSTGLCGRITLR